MGAFIGDGTVFYRHGKEEWSDPQTPIGKWRINSGQVFTLLPDGTGKANWHAEGVLWNQDADGVVRGIMRKATEKLQRMD